MSKTANPEVAGRGARKRRESEAQKARDEALRWWTQPGVVVFMGAVALAVVGWGLVYRESRKIPVHQADAGGLHLRLDDARWILDQMEHGENFQKPSVMMPGMPEWGKQRITLSLELQNRSDTTQIFDASELSLVPEIGDAVGPMGAQVGRAPLGPGQSFNTSVHFDFDTTAPHGKLLVRWRRGEKSFYFSVPEPAEHYHLRPRSGALALPPDARLVLPLGSAERGESLYKQVYGCIACHGDPDVPGSNNVGPHLGSIGITAETRVEGLTGAQYIYESILYPGKYIAPECKNGAPCPEPTAMPDYGSLVTLEHVADLLAYLLDQKRPTEAKPARAKTVQEEPAPAEPAPAEPAQPR